MFGVYFTATLINFELKKQLYYSYFLASILTI